MEFWGPMTIEKLVIITTYTIFRKPCSDPVSHVQRPRQIRFGQASIVLGTWESVLQDSASKGIKLLILGVETSCDETGIALYDSSKGLLADLLHSQIAMHKAYGGVVPELASRDHIRQMVPLLRQACQAASIALNDIDAIAVTEGPGLSGALLTGAGLAAGLGLVLGKPLIAIHHLEGHLLSPLMTGDEISAPYVALLVSGGHTQLMRVSGVGQYELLGETIDDAAGEAFDKCASLLGLSYPGGPALSKLAQSGNGGRFKLPRPLLNNGTLDFSFSGLKTAVAHLVKQTTIAEGSLSETSRADIAAGFEAAVVDVLAAKCGEALRRTGAMMLVVAGGVGANSELRRRLQTDVALTRRQVRFPPQHLCTDNGAMIAHAAVLRWKAGIANIRPAADGFNVRPRWVLGG